LPAIDKGFKGQGINIAILDTGVAAHEDLVIKGGVSFVDGASSFEDDQGHGTHIAGTIGAINNKLGVVGVAPEANIYSVKVLDKNGTGSYSQIIQGIGWAIENRMNIISMSLGGNTDSQALHEIILKAKEQGIILVAAAGNSGQGVETEAYPAKYSEVISVGAIDSLHKRASFSSTGSELDLMAPGLNILSTTFDGKYGVMSGTSMAAPHVAGIAASIWSSNYELTSDEVQNKLLSSAIPCGNSYEYGKGIVSLSNALGITQNTNGNSVNPSQQDYIMYDKEFNENLESLQRLKEIALEKNQIDYEKEIEQVYSQVLIEQNNNFIPYQDDISKLENIKDLKEDNIADFNKEYYERNVIKFSKLKNYLIEKVDHYSELLNVQLDTLKTGTETLSEIIPLWLNDPINVYNYEEYFTFSPLETKDYKFYTAPTLGSNFESDTYLEIYSDPEFTNLIADNDDANGRLFSEIKMNLSAYVTYYVRVSSASFNSLNASINVTDDMSTTINKVITVGSPQDFSEPVGTKIYFEFTAPQDGVFKIYTDYYRDMPMYGGSDTVLAVYSDDQFTNLIAFNDDANGTRFSEVKIQRTKGSKIYIRLLGHIGRSINTRIKISETSPQFTNLVLKTPVNVIVPEDDFKAFAFTPTQTGLYSFSTEKYNGSGNPSDTFLGLYDDANLTEKLDENDDYDNNNILSQINYQLTAGKTYYLILKGYANQAISAQIIVKTGDQYYYDIDGKLDYIILTDGRRYDYIYDSNGNLIRKTIVSQ
jgi:hypothetical protein